jgi:hypothetical protein
MERHDLYDHAQKEYLRCCKVRLGSWERHYNQSYMAFLRDFIAIVEGRTAESVQNEYEAQANQ